MTKRILPASKETNCPEQAFCSDNKQENGYRACHVFKDQLSCPGTGHKLPGHMPGCSYATGTDKCNLMESKLTLATSSAHFINGKPQKHQNVTHNGKIKLSVSQPAITPKILEVSNTLYYQEMSNTMDCSCW